MEFLEVGENSFWEFNLIPVQSPTQTSQKQVLLPRGTSLKVGSLVHCPASQYPPVTHSMPKQTSGEPRLFCAGAKMSTIFSSPSEFAWEWDSGGTEFLVSKTDKNNDSSIPSSATQMTPSSVDGPVACLPSP